MCEKLFSSLFFSIVFNNRILFNKIYARKKKITLDPTAENTIASIASRLALTFVIDSVCIECSSKKGAPLRSSFKSLGIV